MNSAANAARLTAMPKLNDWLGLKQELPPRRRWLLAVLSFVLPLVVWSLVSYVPFVWHPLVRITSPGDIEYFSTGMDVPRADFSRENEKARTQKIDPAQGYRVNPPYLPAPHTVARAFVTAFQTPPRLPDEPWLYQSLGHSIRTIFWGFVISSIIGVPLGVPRPGLTASLPGCRNRSSSSSATCLPRRSVRCAWRCWASTTRRKSPSFSSARSFSRCSSFPTPCAGSIPPSWRPRRPSARAVWRLLRGVIIPASIIGIYTDMRILLGWAWTYLIVAEVVGTMSGITYFINQQARYRNFPNVYAAIAMIGVIGLATDFVLAWIGNTAFPWQRVSRRASRVLAVAHHAPAPRVGAVPMFRKKTVRR